LCAGSGWQLYMFLL